MTYRFSDLAAMGRKRGEHDLADRCEAYMRGETVSAVPAAPPSPGANDSTSPALGEHSSDGPRRRAGTDRTEDGLVPAQDLSSGGGWLLPLTALMLVTYGALATFAVALIAEVS